MTPVIITIILVAFTIVLALFGEAHSFGPGSNVKSITTHTSLSISRIEATSRESANFEKLPANLLLSERASSFLSFDPEIRQSMTKFPHSTSSSFPPLFAVSHSE